MERAYIIRAEEAENFKRSWTLQIPGGITFSMFAVLLDILKNDDPDAAFTFRDDAAKLQIDESKDIDFAAEYEHKSALTGYLDDTIKEGTILSYDVENGSSYRIVVLESIDGVIMEYPMLIDRSKEVVEADADGAEKARISSALEQCPMTSAGKEPAAAAPDRWILSCLWTVPMLYGSMPVEAFMKLVRRGEDWTEDAVLEKIAAVDEEDNPCVIIGDRIVSRSFAENNFWQEIAAQQGDIPYYLPSKREIMEIAKEGYPASDQCCRRLQAHLIDSLDLSAEEAGNLTGMCWYNFSLSDGIEGILRMFESKKISFGRDADAMKFAELARELMFNTRQLRLRGWTLNELGREAERERKNTNTVKKVYPNEPCPCGSGMKYKHCHGKK